MWSLPRVPPALVSSGRTHKTKPAVIHFQDSVRSEMESIVSEGKTGAGFQEWTQVKRT